MERTRDGFVEQAILEYDIKTLQSDADDYDLLIGKWMIKLLDKLHWSVQNKTMRDYFVEERNMLASVKQENLMSSQKQLKRIIDNPVMFLYYVLEKIEYESQDYPRLNFPRLLELLTQNEMVLRNPNLVQPVYVASAESNRDYWEDMRAYENYYNHVPKDLKHVQPTQVNDTITEIPVSFRKNVPSHEYLSKLISTILGKVPIVDSNKAVAVIKFLRGTLFGHGQELS